MQPSSSCHTPGLQDASICQAIVARPSLLGLEVDKNLEKIVDYLKVRLRLRLAGVGG